MSGTLTRFAPRADAFAPRQALEDKLAIAWDRFVLPNGLTVIVHENRAVPLVTVNIWYKVGTKDERVGKTGLAHLFEHLMFGGSANMPGSYLSNMGQIGALEMNGTTNFDRTNFYQTVQTGSLDAALFAESDRMGHFLETLGSEVLEQQRGVVLNEKRQTEDGPYGKFQECLVRGLYPLDHPYGHTTIGWQDDIEGLTLEDTRDWFRAHYAPSNAVLALAGDIDLETARAKAIEFFGHIPPGRPLRRPVRWVPARRGARREVMEDRVSQARLVMAFNIPPAGDAAATCLSQAVAILGQGPTSRLYRRLVERDQLATSASIGFAPMMLSGQFIVFADLAEGADMAALEAAARAELDLFCREGPSADELERAKINAEAGLIRQLQTSQAVADLLAMNEVYFGDPGCYQAEMEWLGSLGVEEVRKSSAEWLGNEADYTLHIVPQGVFAAEGTGIDRSVLPMIDPPAGVTLPRVEQAALSNGIRVLLAERHGLPLVNCKMIVPRGATSERRDRMGLAQITAGLMSRGAGGLDADAMHDVLDRNAIGVGVSIGADFSGVGLSALRSRLDLALDLQADMIRRPRFDAAVVSKMLAQHLAGLRNARAMPGSAATRVLPALLYGSGHDYARLTGGTPAMVGAITRDDIIDLHCTIFDAAGATFIVVGDVTMDEILPKLERRYGDWPIGQVTDRRASAQPAASAEPGVYLVDRPGATQSAITAALLIPAHDAIDPPALTVVNTVLGGSFGSRINMNLREHKSWTYGIQTEIGGVIGERAFVLSGQVQGDRTADSMVEIAREYAEIVSTRPIDAANLAMTQQGEIMALPSQVQTLGSLMGSIETLIQHNWPLDHWSGYADRIRALDLATVNALARRIIRPDRLIWLVAGDRALIEDDIVRAGFGPIHIVPPDVDDLYR